MLHVWFIDIKWPTRLFFRTQCTCKWHSTDLHHHHHQCVELQQWFTKEHVAGSTYLVVQFPELSRAECSTTVYLEETTSCRNRVAGRQTLQVVTLVMADDIGFHLQQTTTSKKIGKGFIENEWKAVSNNLLQQKLVWDLQMDKQYCKMQKFLSF